MNAARVGVKLIQYEWVFEFAGALELRGPFRLSEVPIGHWIAPGTLSAQRLGFAGVSGLI